MSIAELRPGQLRILKAVAALLEDPSAKVTIASIARQIGVTEAAIYRHYRSKNDIFLSIMDYMEANFLGPLNTVQKESNSTAERLETVFERYMAFFEGHPGLARLFLGHGSSAAPGLGERVQLLNAKIRAQVAQMLRYGYAQDELHEGISSEQAAELFYGLIVAAAMGQVFSLAQVDVSARWQVFSHTVLRPKVQEAA